MDLLANLPFTTSGALIDCVDKKVLVHLRDDRRLIGVLRSYDQYANLVLTQTSERIFHPPSRSYAEVPHGVYLVRGENVVLLGEIDLDTEDAPLMSMKLVPYPELMDVLKRERAERERRTAHQERVLLAQKGFGGSGDKEDKY